MYIGPDRYLIAVSPTDTLFDVRRRLLSPPTQAIVPPSWPDFSMSVDQKPLSREQERSTTAGMIAKSFLSLHATESNRGKVRTGYTSGILDRPVKRTRQENSPNADEIKSGEDKDGHVSVDDGTIEGKGDSVEFTVEEDPHARHTKSVSESKATLKKLFGILNDPKNNGFCSMNRRQEWSREIDAVVGMTPDDLIVGCLGQTGVGKSSLLNALLDEADILPTSGSRGCTAAVVELRYNKEFASLSTGKTAVYKGRVEFIALNDWIEELKFLLDDCCASSTGGVLGNAPDDEEAKAAWHKINQVYGHGTMEALKGKPSAEALEQLSHDPRVVELLKGDSGQQTILVEEGVVDVAKAKVVKESFSKLPAKLRQEKKQWATNFRNKINDYVYRKGDGKEPQTWPLIRKVVLLGPWDVLRTGACLVDLPGM